VDTVEGLRDAARRARECAVMGHAVALARWSEEEPEEPRPFGLNEVNRRLAALGREAA
jgi:hypothetical protein